MKVVLQSKMNRMEFTEEHVASVHQDDERIEINYDGYYGAVTGTTYKANQVYIKDITAEG